MIDIPEPKDGEDFYIAEKRRFTVSIDVEVSGIAEDDSETDMCSKAISGLKDGSLDGSPNVVHIEKIKSVELDFETDLPFDRNAWLKVKMADIGLNEAGNPLRPGEKVRPECETTLADFPSRSVLSLVLSRITRWCRKAIQPRVCNPGIGSNSRRMQPLPRTGDNQNMHLLRCRS